MSRRPDRRPTGDQGSAVVDFALVGGLLTLVFLSVVQLGLVLHVRNTLIDSASEGARWGARAGSSPQDGAEQALALVGSELTPGYAARVGDVSAREVDLGGVRAVEVSITAPLPLIGLIGPAGALTVRGHAFAEVQ